MLPLSWDIVDAIAVLLWHEKRDENYRQQPASLGQRCVHRFGGVVGHYKLRRYDWPKLRVNGLPKATFRRIPK
jgi:hypothetical protein